jgi:hypothetical protein
LKSSKGSTRRNSARGVRFAEVVEVAEISCQESGDNLLLDGGSEVNHLTSPFDSKEEPAT